MKRKIRKGVFETNSSSMHSVTVKRKGCDGELKVNKSCNKVIACFGEFGWGYDCYTDPETKLSYLVTMLVMRHYDCYSVEELCETDDFKRINEVVASHCHCDGVLIAEIITQSMSWDGQTKYNWNEHNGYIDHQSIVSINDLLGGCGCTLEEFIFDSGVKLIIER